MKHTINFILLLTMLAGFASCQKDDNSTPQNTTPPTQTTEQKLSGYTWHCTRITVYYYQNGNNLGTTDSVPGFSYLELKTNHTYLWQQSMSQTITGTWSVMDDTHMKMDDIIYDISELTASTLNVNGEKTTVVAGDVFLNKQYFYFGK